jgi:hypothetical protein
MATIQSNHCHTTTMMAGAWEGSAIQAKRKRWI